MRAFLRQMEPSVGQGGLAVADQGVVSLTSFALTITLGRVAGPSELALYSLATTVLLVLAGIQDSLISSPYTVYGARLSGNDRAEYAGCTLAFSAGLAVAASATLALGGALTFAGVGPSAVGDLMLVAAAAAPAFVLRELARRASAADLRIGVALSLDLLVGILQGLGIVWLATRGELSAARAIGLSGIANACGAAGWLVVSWRQGRVQIRPGRFQAAWREHWSLGRWVGAGRVVSHLGSDVLLLWLVTLSLGASSAGLFAACLTIAFLANPVVLGVGLFLTPRLAAGFAGGGLPAVAELVRSTTRALALLLAVFVAAVAMAGERVLGMAYGPAYAGLGPAAASAAAAVALGALSLGPTSALTVIERPALNVAAGLLGLVAMLASAAILIPSYGVVGAGLSFCAANATQLVVRSGLLARAVAAAPRGQLARAELLRGKGTI